MDVFLMNKDGKVIKLKNQVKILVICFNSHNNMNAQISAVAVVVGLAYKIIEPYLKHAQTNHRKILA